MNRKTVTALLLSLLFLCPSFAGAEENPWTHTFYFENDLFTGTDSNYTNGIKYSLISPDLSPRADDGKLPRKVLEYIHRIPFIRESEPQYTHKVEFSIGQNIFTPADISQGGLIKDDRPYAGWTYVSTSYHRKSSSPDTVSFMDSVEVQIGIVGPESFAEQSQRLIHKIRDLQRPNGWDNQLKNEPGLAMVFERKWLFHPGKREKPGYSFITHAGGALGNVHTYLNSGCELRLGWNIPEDFGVSIIRPAGSTRLSIGKDFSIYGFAAVNGRLVFQDVFLDGNTFTDSHSIDKKIPVADVAAGLAINFRHFIISWTQVLRTKEFKGQERAHSFGALAVSYSFPYDLRNLLEDRLELLAGLD